MRGDNSVMTPNNNIKLNCFNNNNNNNDNFIDLKSKH